MEKEINTCFFCKYREKVTPDDIKCMKSGKIFEETFGGTIKGRYEGCPLSEEEKATAFSGEVMI